MKKKSGIRGKNKTITREYIHSIRGRFRGKGLLKTLMAEKLADVLEKSKKEEVIIRRRKGDSFSIVPKSPVGRSPFDVSGLHKNISRKEIIEAIRESRKRI